MEQEQRETLSYSEQLRTLGQAIEPQEPGDFVIEVVPSGYVFESDKTKLSLGMEKLVGLQRQGVARRQREEGVANPGKLSQLLRAVGADLDSLGASPEMISRHGVMMTIEFQSRGNAGAERRLASSYYDYAIQMYGHGRGQASH